MLPLTCLQARGGLLSAELLERPRPSAEASFAFQNSLISVIWPPL
jgi:hypothetical protein